MFGARAQFASRLLYASRVPAFVPSLLPRVLAVTRPPSRCVRRTIMTLPNGTSGPLSNHAVAVPDCSSSTHWQQHRAPDGEPASGPGEDWIGPVLEELREARDFRPPGAKFHHPPRVLILYGSLRERGFSRFLAYECARLLDGLGADVRVFDPHGLPVRDPAISDNPKVVELRELVDWSEAHVWCASELHGNLCSVFKNQIDWIPLNTGSVRPTQGKSVAVLQVNGGSQSFNVVNTLRLLARWMRMPCVVNQSSVQKAWMEFDDDGRMKASSMRDRMVDVMEEFIKFARVNREFAHLLNSRYSERKEKKEKGRLLTQAEKEALKAEEAKKAANND